MARHSVESVELFRRYAEGKTDFATIDEMIEEVVRIRRAAFRSETPDYQPQHTSYCNEMYTSPDTPCVNHFAPEQIDARKYSGLTGDHRYYERRPE